MKRPHERRQWLKTAKVLWRLAHNHSDISAVFETLGYLAGSVNRKGYAKMMDSLEGGKIAYDQVELYQLQADPEWRRSFAPGTLGAAYCAFVEREGVDTGTLIPVMQGLPDGWLTGLEHPLAWYVRRNVALHDVWHVITGYGRDSIGESALVGFSYVKTRSLGFLAIALGGMLVLSGGRRAIAEGIWNGIRAQEMINRDYVQLFSMDLNEVRRILGVRQPRFYP